MTNFNLDTNAAYNFKAPAIVADADKKIEVVFPTQGTATAVVKDGVATVEVERQVTVVDLGALAADVELKAEIASHVERGANLLVKAASGAVAKTITFGTGFSSPTMAGTIDKSKSMYFVFDGTKFIATGVAVTLN